MTFDMSSIRRREWFAGDRKFLADKKRFYREVSKQCNHLDEEIVEMIYLAIVQVITNDIIRHGVARAPFLGDFKMRKAMEKFFTRRGSKPQMVEQFRVSFYMREMFKRYLNHVYNRVKTEDRTVL